MTDLLSLLRLLLRLLLLLLRSLLIRLLRLGQVVIIYPLVRVDPLLVDDLLVFMSTLSIIFVLVSTLSIIFVFMSSLSMIFVAEM